MKFIKKLFAPKEIKAAIGILDEADYKFNSTPAFQFLRKGIEEVILTHPDDFVNVIRKKIPVRQWVYSAIANAAGDQLESGQNHLYRSLLNPRGERYLQIFRASIDELVQIGAIEEDKARKQKVTMDDLIYDVG